MSVATTTAIGIAGGVAAAGAGIAKGVIAKKAADKQADSTLQATRESLALQEKIYNQNRTDSMPWLNAGSGAITQLSSLLAPGGDLTKDFTSADFKADPGYDFRLAEGNKALQRSAAANGNLYSGGTLKALTRYNQGFASNEFQNAYNRFQANRNTRFNQLADVAGLGQSSANTLANAGTNYAANAGNTIVSGAENAANARAAGTIALGQGITNGITNGISSLPWYQLSQLMRRGGTDIYGAPTNYGIASGQYPT